MGATPSCGAQAIVVAFLLPIRASGVWASVVLVLGSRNTASIVVHRLSCSAAYGSFTDQGSDQVKPVSPAEVDFTAEPRSPKHQFFVAVVPSSLVVLPDHQLSL